MEKVYFKSPADTGTRVLDNTTPILCSSIASFWITPAGSKERKYHIFRQYWYTKNVPVFTNTGTFKYLGPEVYFFLIYIDKSKLNIADMWLIPLDHVTYSGVARAFPGGRLAHPEGQNEEENLSKVWGKIDQKFEEKVRTVELLPTRDCEAGYGPGHIFIYFNSKFKVT